jgi:hypothetical protein
MADFGVGGAREKWNTVRDVVAFYCRHLRQPLKHALKLTRPELWMWYRSTHELVSKEWEAPGE